MLADILECRTGLVGETGNRNWKKKWNFLWWLWHLYFCMFNNLVLLSSEDALDTCSVINKCYHTQSTHSEKKTRKLSIHEFLLLLFLGDSQRLWSNSELNFRWEPWKSVFFRKWSGTSDAGSLHYQRRQYVSFFW